MMGAQGLTMSAIARWQVEMRLYEGVRGESVHHPSPPPFSQFIHLAPKGVHDVDSDWSDCGWLGDLGDS